MKRGEIYYIKNERERVGHEIMKDRPGVIVSNDGFNEKAGMVTIVYLTRTPREDLLSHVTIRSTGIKSEALCEQISTVSASRVNRYIGTATPAEMEAIETAIQIHLAMQLSPERDAAAGQAENSRGGVSLSTAEITDEKEALIRATAERDTLRGLCEKMLDRLTNGGATA